MAFDDSQEATDDLLRRAAEAAGTGAWCWNLVSDRLTLSLEAARLLGAHSAAEGGLLALVHGDDRTLVEGQLRDRAAAGARFDLDIRTCSTDAATGWIQLRGAFSADGREAWGVATDIASRRADQEATSRLAAIVASTDDAVIGKTLDGIVTDWNRAAEIMFGYTAAEMIGKPVALLVPPGHDDEEPAILARIAQGERIERYETVRQRKDGSLVAVSVTVSPVWDKSGRLLGASKIARDITAARHSRDQMADREAHLRSILDTAPDAMVVIDDHGLITSFSANAERLFGYTVDEIVGRNVSVLMPTTDATQHDSYMSRYRQTRRQNVIGRGRVVVGQRRDGTSFPMELAVGEVRSNGRQFFTGFVRDLTQRRATEQRLQELQGELAHLSRLTAMGEMATTLAHELNQPLTAVAGYLNGCRRLLASSTTDEAVMVRDAVERAGAQAMRAGQIIRRLREFVSRGECTQRSENLMHLVEEASALAMIGAHEFGSDVRFSFDGRATAVFVDKVQVQQVLVNLMRNAMEAMQAGARRELAISTSFADADPGMVTVSVADTGPGISADISSRLFQPFVTTKTQGMGIGLSISRSIVEAHGGRLWVEPNSGGGSVFRMTLKASPANWEHASG